MEFLSAIAILVTYYLRPQDWVPGLAGANLMTPVALVGIASVFLRERGFQLRDLLRTPHDAMVFLYAAYIVFTAPDFMDAFKGIAPFLVFYVVTVQGLSDTRRAERYLRWWFVLLVVLAAVAVGSYFGFDPMNAKGATERFNGRLAIDTWIHNNPNALGHSVILAIPLAYVMMCWRRPFWTKLLALVPMAIAFYCVFKTESRGAFIAGMVVATVTLATGRRKLTQFLLIAFVVTIGTGLMAVIPRMDRVEDLRADEGVQGRMMVWEIARTTSRLKTYGEGWKQFEAYITNYDGEVEKKATHSCFVKVGADLGYAGLFLYLGIMWCSFRTVVGYSPEDESGERARRALIVLLVGYLVSGWMIDRSYHTEYFLMAAVAAAIQRLRIARPAEEAEEATGAQRGEAPRGAREPAEEGRAAPGEDAGRDVAEPVVRVGFTRELHGRVMLLDQDDEGAESVWNRFRFFDAAIAVGLVWATLWVWDYIIKTFHA